MKKLILLLGVTLFSSAQAGVIRDTAKYFNTSGIGSLQSFQWVPSTYSDADHPNDFKYDIFYYIPSSIQNNSQVKSLIFLHGGGGSTVTRSGSIDAVKLYTDDLIQLAEDLGVVVVLPSANGLNWAGHTMALLHNLSALMRAELDIDPNFIGLSGHSMGGMGISRVYTTVTDEFAFFLPMASGVDVSMYNAAAAEQQYNKVFNVPYLALEGNSDSFQDFIDNCHLQQTATDALETKYGIKSKLTVHFYDTDHNYQYPVFKQFAQQAFQTPRDLYQKELFATVRTADRWLTENNILFRWTQIPRYFWLASADADISDSKYEAFIAHAKIIDNTVNIDLPVTPKNTKTLRVYFSSKMEDLTKPLDIVINGVKVATRDPAKAKVNLQSFSATDPGYQYEDFMDVSIAAGGASPAIPAPAVLTTPATAPIESTPPTSPAIPDNN